jgi:hypothetical protein
MTTLEGNKLIAKFMGFTMGGCYYMPQHGRYEAKYGSTEYVDTFRSDELEYHSHWDWLMPVVRKIVEYSINENEDAFGSDEYTSILETVPLAIIEDAWKVVVEFILAYTDEIENEVA